MTNIKVEKENNLIVNIEIKGHANYDDIGKDIVCASISSIVTTTVNAIVRLYGDSIIYVASEGYINIEVNKHNEYIDTLIINMLELLKELTIKYKKNVKINI